MTKHQEKEYWIFSDESVQDGPLFSNFFGGAIVAARHYAEVENRLRIRKAEIGFIKELKWQRVTPQWLDGYKLFITAFFDEVRTNLVRVRVMFRDNQNKNSQPTRDEKRDAYFKLYYQFIKHAFGLAHIPEQEEGTRLRLFFDQFPDTRLQAAFFKGYIANLPKNPQLRSAKLSIHPDHITEIDSKEHVLLQAVDLVTGSMAFRLNDLHKAKPEGSRLRGKRTIAKEALYKHILQEIRTVKPFLNPKISTACEPFPEGNWLMPYRHWSFKPRTYEDSDKK